MKSFRPLPAYEQVAAHLRDEILHGDLSNTVPGVRQLIKSLGVSQKTVVAALRILEHEGLVEGPGPGCQRRIVQADAKNARTLRVAILPYERGVQQREFLNKLPGVLAVAGHSVSFVHKALKYDLKMDVGRLSRLVQQTAADAWVVMAGSREVLQWFSRGLVPAFALFGRREGLPMAGIGADFRTGYAQAVRQLARLGHRRVVLLVRRERRLPEPGLPERAFLDELKACGLPVGDYNLPNWEETTEGLAAVLESLFAVTPPTALIIDEPDIFLAVQHILGTRRIWAPRQVSLVCSETHPFFKWSTPTISHIRWNEQRVVPRIKSWASALSRGRRDVTQTLVPSEFVPGDSIGPVPK